MFGLNLFGKSANSQVTISKLIKDCKLPIAEILQGKYPNLSVNKLNPITYTISEILPKTGTKVVFKVFDNGQIAGKTVFPGCGNTVSTILQSAKTVFSRTLKNAKPSLEATKVDFTFKIPVSSLGEPLTSQYKRVKSGLKAVPNPLQL